MANMNADPGLFSHSLSQVEQAAGSAVGQLEAASAPILGPLSLLEQHLPAKAQPPELWKY